MPGKPGTSHASFCSLFRYWRFFLDHVVPLKEIYDDIEISQVKMIELMNTGCNKCFSNFVDNLPILFHQLRIILTYDIDGAFASFWPVFGRNLVDSEVAVKAVHVVSGHRSVDARSLGQCCRSASIRVIRELKRSRCIQSHWWCCSYHTQGGG